MPLPQDNSVVDAETIRWPVRFDPKNAPVHVHNSIDIAAPPAAIWAVLVAAPQWPEWYANARNVELEDGRPELGSSTRFRWTTFGCRLHTIVQEFEPPCRIAWRADGPGVSAYHAWLIAPRGEGSHVLTEESQHGWLARTGALFAPRRMWRWHQRWLDGLRDRAEAAGAGSGAQRIPLAKSAACSSSYDTHWPKC